ncbi:MAG: GDP-mannose 4,6-dehydratase [Candidatus Omnitrophica bacterium]|nr:GDP-mannose 4,6-dehydratase [Candidatus Omnitrophota bacterium]
MDKSHILIIDDDKDATGLISTRLESYGFKVSVANIPGDAFEFLKENIPDLIILDLVMPGIDGYEVLSKIRLDKKTKEVPVIVLTAKLDQSDKLNAFNLGAQDYITKPYEPEEFLARIKVALKGGSHEPVVKKIKNVLITGGAGFIGSALSRRLLAQEYKVTVIDDLSTGSRENIQDMLNNKNFNLIVGSITDETILSKAIEESDLIYHLAATVGVKNVIEKPLDTVIYDTIGTSIVLKYASAKGVKVVLTSTSEVYGKSKKYPFKEDDDVVIGPPDVNRWSYACSKLLDEFFAIGYHRERELPVVIVRFFNIVGPGQVGRYGMVIPRFFKAALQNQPIYVYGDGKQARCFTYIDDAIDILLRLSESQKAIGEVINLGSNNLISIKKLAHDIKRITKSSSRIVFEPHHKYYGNRFQDVKKRVPDLTKLKKLSGVIPKTTLPEILKQMKRYFEENPRELDRI